MFFTADLCLCLVWLFIIVLLSRVCLSTIAINVH